MIDQISKGAGSKPFVTEDLVGGHFMPAPNFTFPVLFRHGSLLPLQGDEYDRLEKAFGKLPAAKAQSDLDLPPQSGSRLKDK
ncbi:hypothetical protein HNR46_003713 [Haloferula luteola]|uniref:Uncharacterized protein n=1 Tax=Haloferula luteola TaxID=595692 RepID=A0A840V654_9BACT|nr:hypothetical protein [Haloferula luteola]MBB5353452.1 hypothetical protein [Haloferula luteola]